MTEKQFKQAKAFSQRGMHSKDSSKCDYCGAKSNLGSYFCNECWLGAVKTRGDFGWLRNFWQIVESSYCIEDFLQKAAVERLSC